MTEQHPDQNPEVAQRQNRASELPHEVGLLLLANARRRGGFRVDPDELALELAQIGDRFDDALLLVRDGEPQWDAAADLVVEVTPLGADRIGLECRYGRGSVSADLRIDGVLENETSGFATRQGGATGRSDPDAQALTPDEEEVLRRASTALREEREDGTPPFRGAAFVRALAAEPQPGAVVRILAAELYADGLVIHYQFDGPVDFTPAVPLFLYARAGIKPPIAKLLAEAKAAGSSLVPSVSVADDVGTPYRHVGAQAGGLQIMRAAARFTPAVPPAAEHLCITTYGGQVRLDLSG